MTNWLTNIFDDTLLNYKINARKSVENFASEAWLSMTPEPKKYKGIKINENGRACFIFRWKIITHRKSRNTSTNSCCLYF